MLAQELRNQAYLRSSNSFRTNELLDSTPVSLLRFITLMLEQMMVVDSMLLIHLSPPQF